MFIALAVTYSLYNNSTYLLENFSGRVISLATSEGLDIAHRVALYYRGIFLFCTLTIGIGLSYRFWRNFLDDADRTLLNALSVVGFSFFLFRIFGAEMGTSLHFIYGMLFAVFSGVVGKKIMQWQEKNSGEYILVFSWLTLISVLLFFLQWHFLRLFSEFHFRSIPDFCGPLTAALLLIYFYFSKQQSATGDSVTRYIRISRPLIFIPLNSLFSFELSMIFNQHGMHISPAPIFLIGTGIILFLIYRLSKKSSLSFSDAKSQLSEQWIPWMLAGIVALVLYKPVVTPEIDWFEDGNRILPLQQWFQFGKIPFLDTFSSHALSDWGWGALYSLLNGADPMGVFVYGFLLGPIVSVLIYFLILRLSDSPFIALFIALFYPYTDFLIPSYYHLVPLTAILLIRLSRNQSVKNYFLYFLLLLFMMVWRIDLGISNFIAGVGGLLLVWYCVPDFKIQMTSLKKAALYTGISVVFIFCIALIIQGPTLLFSRLGEMTGYLNSLQAYGLKDLSSAANNKYYSLYFVMPVVVLMIAGYAFYKLIRSEEISSPQALISVTIIFFSIFYISNLQRGLVRHTLAEQWDTALTSYGFLILVSPVFYRIRKNQSLAYSFFGFFALATIVVVNYKLDTPEGNRNNFYDAVVRYAQGPLPVKLSFTGDRTIEPGGYRDEKYGELDLWMKKNTADTSTFLDFSNTPMLYYFLNRKTPNYLCQIPHTAHNDVMQDYLLNELPAYDIPVTLFANYPQSYWDQLDGIPNALRHYKISEYIYSHYSPYAILNHHSVWAKKGSTFPEIKIRTQLQYNELRNLSISGAVLTDSISLRATGGQAQLNNILPGPLHLDRSKKYYVLLSAWFENQSTVTFVPNFSNKGFDESRRAEARVYSGPSKAFFIIEPKGDEAELSGLKIILPSQGAMSLSSLQINSCDVLPDLISELPQEYDLRNIPYIWGQYDEAWKQGKITEPLILLQTNKSVDQDRGMSLSIPAHQRDSVYQYVRLSARAKTDKPVHLILRYGKDHETRGSYIFTIHPSDKMEDYLVRMSSLYTWNKNDQNWISVYAMHGDAEINLVELRREQK